LWLAENHFLPWILLDLPMRFCRLTLATYQNDSKSHHFETGHDFAGKLNMTIFGTSAGIEQDWKLSLKSAKFHLKKYNRIRLGPILLI
jgi:hypothetical protein